ncbi:unnamed protein product, partial [marine sediment metagenome]
ENNIALSPFNNRGSGLLTDFRKSNKNVEIIRLGTAREKFEDCLFDIKAHLDFLEKQGFTNIHLCGHSLGTCKVIYYLAKTQDKRVNSVILLSPSDMLGLVRKDKERFKEEIITAEKMIKQGKGNRLMPRDVWDEIPITANSYLNLFGDNSETAIFNFYNSKDKSEKLSKISCPILSVMGKKDDSFVVSIKDTMRIIKERAKSSPRCEYKILGDADHNYIEYEQQLADTILKWINSF